MSRDRNLSFSLVFVLFSLVILAAGAMFLQRASHAQAGAAAVVVSGVVNSEAEGAMEGVLVSAKRVGSTISTTVVTDKQGRYSFPAGSLNPGEYKLSIRATGYDAANPNTTVTVGQKPTTVNLKLNKARDLASQLSSAEWFISIPGTPEQKDLLYRCIQCHTATPILQSTYDATGWLATINRMRSWGPASSLQKPLMLPFHQKERASDAKFAEYLSSINLSAKPKWDFELKTQPRPSGQATRVMVTEYDLPRPDAQPHDAVIDAGGMVWYIDFAEPVLGRLDPRTGETKEWKLPELRPGFDGGSLDLELDRDGNPWVGRLLQAGVAKFDKKTETFLNWSVPKEYLNPKSRAPFLAFGLQDKIWFPDTWNRMMYLLDPRTGHMDRYPAYPGWTVPEIDMGSGAKGKEPQGHFIYGVNADSKGNAYLADMAGGNIGVMDPSGKVELYPTPTVNSGPRRMHVDQDDKLWFAENYGLKIGKFDPETKRIEEWADPTPWDAPYDAVRDKAGYVWTGGMMTDLVSRLNPKTGEFTQYLLPSQGVNIRRVEVDNSTLPPRLFVGENHRAKIAFVQPLN
jgi:virginiamycin B lyase